MTAAEIVDALVAAGHKWPGGRNNAEIHRTRAGWLLRAAGAWSWFLWPKKTDYAPYPAVGGYSSAARLRKSWTTVEVEKIGTWTQLVLEPKENYP